MIGDTEIHHTCPNLLYLLENPESLRTHVAICYYGRSGSFLLSSLFDNHPEVLSMPLEAAINFFSIFREFYEQKFKVDESIFQSILSHLIEKHPNIFKKDDSNPTLGNRQFGKDNGVYVLDFSNAYLRGLRKLIETNTISFQNLANLVPISYAVARGRKLDTRNPIAIWQIHNPMSIDERRFLRNTFPDFKFITTVRLPEKSFDSHIIASQVAHHEKWITAHLMDHFLFQDIISDDCDQGSHLAVRFEDMHANTEKVMRALTRWTNINWHPCLLESTLDGGPWTFPDPKARTGLNPKIAQEKHTKCLFWIDRLKLRYLLKKNYRTWGYDAGASWQWLRLPMVRKLVFCIPFKIEMIQFCRDLYKLTKAFFHELFTLFGSFLKNSANLVLEHKHQHRNLIEKIVAQDLVRESDSYKVYVPIDISSNPVESTAEKEDGATPLSSSTKWSPGSFGTDRTL